MKKQLITALASAALTIAVSITAFAGSLTYQITSGDTGKTTAWTNPYTGQTMTIPVVTTDAKITLTGDSGQPITNDYNKDSSLLAYDGIMADFSVYGTQELDMAEIMDRLSSNHTSSPWEGQVPFPEEWVCFVGNDSTIPDVAFYVTSNPDSITGNAVETAGGWKQDANGWRWQNSDGTYAADTWKWIADKCYYFNHDGYMLSGTTTPDGFLVGADGAWIQ